MVCPVPIDLKWQSQFLKCLYIHGSDSGFLILSNWSVYLILCHLFSAVLITIPFNLYCFLCYSWEWRFSSHCSRRVSDLWVFILYLITLLNSSLIAFQLILLDFLKKYRQSYLQIMADLSHPFQFVYFLFPFPNLFTLAGISRVILNNMEVILAFSAFPDFNGVTPALCEVFRGGSGATLFMWQWIDH